MKKLTLIVLILLIIAITLFVTFKFTNEIPFDNSAFSIKDNTVVNVYSDVNIGDFIESIDGKIITNYKIDTTKISKKQVEFKYLNSKRQKRKGTFEIEIKDLEKPIIWLANTYKVKRGEVIDLKNEILAADNYDGNLKREIIGTYDLNKIGNYDLIYIATDSSGNKESVNFTLNVYNPENIKSNENVKQKTVSFNEILEKYKTNNTEIGVDVSKWQGNIDFSKVKKAGASFVMIRVGSQKGLGNEYVIDPYFTQNIENALLNNLKVGIYFYSYANNKKEAENQAQWVINQIKKYDVSLPVAFDFECFDDFNQMNISLYQLNEIAEVYFQKLRQNGYETMLYGSKNYLNNIWKYNKNEVWLAHYTEKSDYDKEYKMWQLSQTGLIDGINTYVDIDVLYK